MTDATAPGAAKPLFSTGYKSVVLSLLLAAYTFNFIDRTILATIGPQIAEQLKLDNTQLGLLGGLYFALLYTILGIPVARLAERFSRVKIISISLVVWSGFTALSGFANNFVQLALCRFGVGIGEAGCSPASHSLISDYFEPRKRATALSIYSFGIPLGSMFGAVAGGWLAQEFGWRVAFMVVGLPGLILGVIVWLVMREPPRGHSEMPEHPVLAEDVTPAAPPERLGFVKGMLHEFAELLSVAKTLFTKWPVVNMVLGVTIASFGSYGSGAFVPRYFLTAFGKGYGESEWTWLQVFSTPAGHFALGLAAVGLITGLVGGFSSGIGTLLGGLASDRLGKRNPVWYSLVPAFGLMIATPIYIAAYMQPDWKAAALILLIPGVFHYTYLGPTFGVVQNSVEPRRRATATALLFFFLNLIALGGGPPFTGWLIDVLSQYNFNHGGGQGVLSSLAGAFGGGDVGASFNTACPGGIAPKGSGADLVSACSATLANSARQGIILSICFYLWASLHYFLGAIGLAKHMRERGEAQKA
ncbi:MFS family permease [Caulobacter ginsengisoli]|uniref:MFS family permease n=1 Tax=Caulobacter ginsengisoli TaxID=400775 RepID=A0ABU0IKC4_9CAUL|nr:MFS transporter [Caulobacter ginsengisoli]MDQ0462455.1 MFS family permease [Caulobacter ginsengisoli]